jgi:amidohydrolase
MPSLDELIARHLPRVTEIRHDLHAHPELGYQERRTSQVVRAELEKAGVKFVGELAGGTGVLGYIPATTDPATAPTVALRADMDALPIQEDTGKPYASQTPGVMHACGHDGHTSILLGAAKVLAEAPERPNNVLLVFQPAEEGGAGGRKMCEDGVLCGKVLGNPADVIFGLHGFPMLNVGQVATCTGPMLASADQFEITVNGKGGHAAMPHYGIDPIVVASHIVTALQTISSRNVGALDSVVVTIGMVKAGTAHNIIPDTAELVGTLRTLNNDTRRLAQQRIRDIATHVAEAFGATADIKMEDGYPVTFNEATAAQRLRAALAESLGAGLISQDCPPVMGGEDFSFYGRETRACFYWLGLSAEGQEQYPNLHAPQFDFNDEALPVGMKAMCSLALSSE